MSAVTAALLKERDQAYAERDLHIRAGELMAQEIEKLEAHIDATDAAWCARAAALTAQVERMRGALEKLHHAVCGETGFAACVRLDSGKAYPWPALDEADAEALAALKPAPTEAAPDAAAIREAALREAADAVSRAAWKHLGDDSYSAGLEDGARKQNEADYDAILALITEKLHDRA